MKSARTQENELLLKTIEKIHAESRGTYGAPRVHAELVLGLGEINRKRVARLMRRAGLQGLYRRRRRGCTWRDPSAEPYADLIERDFTVADPNQLWVTDITEHHTTEGKIYRAAVPTCTHGESWAGRSTTTCAPWLAIHLVGVRVDAGIAPSTGSIGDCYDNSMMESFWGTMQLEVLDSRKWQTRAEPATAIFEWMECSYNPRGRRSRIGMLSPPSAKPATPTRTKITALHRGCPVYGVKFSPAAFASTRNP